MPEQINSKIRRNKLLYTKTRIIVSIQKNTFDKVKYCDNKYLFEAMKKIQLLIVAMIILISQLISCKLENKIEEKSTSDLVYPFLDSSNSRWFYFNSASRPFGMVNLSPDTSIDGDWGAGYIYSKDTILGFSHLHGWQLSGIPVLPGTGVCNLILGPKYYGSKFKHENEIAKPGYHKVILEKYNIKAELSSTTRVGIHKYTFPKNENSYILLDLATVLGPSIPEYGEIKVNSIIN